jgi:DNA-binding response OmpR family regulator
MADPESPSIPVPRVLLVDDHREARGAMAKYLSFSGFAVTEAVNGTTAIAALQAGPPFQILLTDLSLPDMDGFIVARRARELSDKTWIALVTGWSIDTDDALDHGVDQVFFKPVDLGALCRILNAELAANHADPTENP